MVYELVVEGVYLDRKIIVDLNSFAEYENVLHEI